MPGSQSEPILHYALKTSPTDPADNDGEVETREQMQSRLLAAWSEKLTALHLQQVGPTRFEPVLDAETKVEWEYLHGWVVSDSVPPRVIEGHTVETLRGYVTYREESA